MAGQYSHRQFFRHIPNVQLVSYFKAKNIDIAVDFENLEKKRVDKLFEAFTKLPENDQASIEADFQGINALAFDGGVKALVDEAAFWENDDSFAEAIAKIEGFHAKVMWAFLEKKDYWRGASRFLHADNVSPSCWKKRVDFPLAVPCVEDDDIKELAQAISHFFHRKEGKGRNCKVEPYRRHNKEYFFAYPEDFAQSDVEWVSDTLKTRARHPAFEIIFVYCEEDHSLDITAPRNTKVIPDLQKIFAKTILKIDTLPDGKLDTRVYSLDSLNDVNFEFNKPDDSGINDVVVTHLRLTFRQGIGRKIIVSANTSKNTNAVYDLLAELTLPPYDITQIGLKVTFEPLAGQRGKIRRFNITQPNSCALNYNGNDEVIRDMLALSGIEPTTPDND